MSAIRDADTVRIRCTGSLTGGTAFDGSMGRDPLEYVLESGQIIRGLDAALPGMRAGESKTPDIACADACGPINPALHQDVPRAAMPDDIALDVGLRLQIQTPEGQPVPVTITAIDDAQVMPDANHPLAGRDQWVLTLVFEFEVMSAPAA